VIETIKDAAIIKEIIDDFLTGRPVPLERFPAFVAESFTFFFESEKYPGIYYILEYFIDDGDQCYLFDRWHTDSNGKITGRLVPCGVNLFDIDI